jgi:hypothetical protein
MSKNARYSISLGWWVMVLAVAAAALLFAWLGRLAGVPLATAASIGVGGVALAWLIVLVTVPWNLYFSARRVVAEISVSRERGITIPPGHDAEAGRIARRMLWFALGAQLGTAAVAAVIAFISGAKVGYYFSGFFLLSTAIRPAAAYLGHVRERISALARESTHPRDDVASLKRRVDLVAGSVRDLQGELRGVADELNRAESSLAGDITHGRAGGRPDRGPVPGRRPGPADRRDGAPDRGHPGRHQRPPGADHRDQGPGPDDQAGSGLTAPGSGYSRARCSSIVPTSAGSPGSVRSASACRRRNAVSSGRESVSSPRVVA